MIDPATPKALRAIASMMRMEGYRTDATGVEALVLDNAAAEIEQMSKDIRILDALHAGGVDNWEWYSESLREAGLL